MEVMANDKWIYILCALFLGVIGMTGVKRVNGFCLAISASVLPLLVLIALWYGADMKEISCYLCFVAFLVLLGLPGRREK